MILFKKLTNQINYFYLRQYIYIFVGNYSFYWASTAVLEGGSFILWKAENFVSFV